MTSFNYALHEQLLHLTLFSSLEFVMHCAASETTFETLDLNQIISPDSINTRF